MTDIDSALTVVGGDLEVDGAIVAASDLQIMGDLQIGSPNYKMVFLEDVQLIYREVEGKYR